MTEYVIKDPAVSRELVERLKALAADLDARTTGSPSLAARFREQGEDLREAIAILSPPARGDDVSSQDHAPASGFALDWRDISTAPKDGTPILAWCVHPHARHATDDKDWCAAVVTQWINHNGGGWTWNGMSGTFTHWMPLPRPPPPDGATSARHGETADGERT